MQIEYLQLSTLIPYSKNPRKNDPAVAPVAASIKEFGFRIPILIDNNNEIIAGNTRLKAAKNLNLKEVPVIRCEDLTPAQIQAFRLADNKLGEIAEWDIDLLIGELSDLKTQNYDINFTGFDEKELAELLKNNPQGMCAPDDLDAEPQIDNATELNKKWNVQPGQLWQLGNHQLLCGDCTDREVIARIIEGVSLVLTDPPYGLSIVSGKSTGKVGGGGQLGFGKIGGGHIVESKSYPVIVGDESTDSARKAIEALVDIKNKIIFGGNYFTDFLPPSRCWIIWDKENSGNCFADAELAWTSFDKNVKLYHWLWNGLSRKGERVEELKSRVHPTQKPVGLFKQILQDYSEEGAVIIDPFLGSGTTLIACENTGRKCRGIEISSDYCAVILQRYQDATGKTPVLVT
ncbi:MAG TPA: DNA methyltransferase [Methanospirillum sp.]|nr:DNA methyltransferase [Methanospirillum sp.]